MRKYKIKDIAQEISIRIDDPKHGGYEKFVGLEHYDSGKVKILRFGDASRLDSSVKVFKKGDVLIARRNVYLRRASIADFDGVTSGDSIVIRANDSSFRGLLPFVFNTDAFWDYATQYADGSMSKRLSPQRLLEYEVNLPESDAERNKLCKTLWNMYETMSSYEKVIRVSDDLIKSQFIEMFGSVENNVYGWDIKEWNDVLNIRNGKSHKEVNDPNGQYPIYGSGGKMGMSKEYLSLENTIILGRKGTIDKPFISSTKCWIVDTSFGLEVNQKIMHYRFFYEWCRDFDFKKLNRAAVLPSLTKGDLLKIKIICPPIETQMKFVSFIEKVDKSKFHLEKLKEMKISTWQKGGKIYANI